MPPIVGTATISAMTPAATEANVLEDIFLRSGFAIVTLFSVKRSIIGRSNSPVTSSNFVISTSESRFIAFAIARMFKRAYAWPPQLSKLSDSRSEMIPARMRVISAICAIERPADLRALRSSVPRVRFSKLIFTSLTLIPERGTRGSNSKTQG